MSINQTLDQTPGNILNDFLNKLTHEAYVEKVKEIKSALGWSRTTMSSRRLGISNITPAEQIALNQILGAQLF